MHLALSTTNRRFKTTFLLKWFQPLPLFSICFMFKHYSSGAFQYLYTIVFLREWRFQMANREWDALCTTVLCCNKWRHFLIKGLGKRRHIVADTLLPMMFLGLRKLGNICCGHKMFLNKIRNIFVSRTQNLCPQQMLRARANGETYVSATMCPQQCVLVCQGLNAN